MKKMTSGSSRRAFQRLSIAVLMLALAGAAFPQSGKKGEAKERTVEGTVVDSAGKAVPRAIVQLKNVRTQQIRSFIAQDKGDFFFNGLNPDIDYEVRAEADGASSATKTLSSYDGRKAFIVTLKLTKQ
jgi:hypothetical protein